jgi:hypothetical protein
MLFKLMNVRLTIILFVTFSASIRGVAQDSNSLQNWFDYTQINRINGNWSYLGDYAFRFQVRDSDSRWWQIHARPSAIFKNKAIYDLRGGIMFRYTNTAEGNGYEIRPWQGARLFWPNIGRFRFTNYLRTEQRFEVEQDIDELNFVFKIRYKLSTNIPINNPIITSETYYVLIGYEVFFNLSRENEEFIDDRTRFDIGVGYRFNAKTDLRLIYIFQKSRINLEEITNSNDNIIRVSVIQRFGFE